MNPLIPCPSCSRHVRSSEAACPFCSSELPKGLAARAVPAAPRRLERLAAFTFATTMAVVACGDSETTATTEDDLGAIQPMYGMPAPDPDASAPKDGGIRDSGTKPDARSDAGVDASIDAGADADAGPCKPPVVRDGGGVMPLYGAPADPCPDTPVDPPRRDGGGIVPLYGAPADDGE